MSELWRWIRHRATDLRIAVKRSTRHLYWTIRGWPRRLWLSLPFVQDEKPPIEIHLGSLGTGEVYLAGENIAHYVHGIDVEMRVGELTQVTLYCHGTPEVRAFLEDAEFEYVLTEDDPGASAEHTE